MSLKTTLLAFSSIMLLSISAVAETLTIHGSTTVDANLFQPYKSQLEEKTGLQLNIIANGSSRGITGIDSGKADIGMISSSLEGTLKKANMEARAAEFIGTKVGETQIAFAVHASNPVKEISSENIQKILMGEIINWSTLGGNNMPIIVITEYAGGGIRSTIEKKVLDKKPISAASIRELQNGSQITKVAGQIPPVFATTTLKALSSASNLSQVTTDVSIIQPLILVTKGEPNEAAQKLIEAAKEVLE